jgi:DNA modification methylase
MTNKTFKGLPQSGLTSNLKARDKARRLERGALASISGAGEKRRNDRLPQLEIISHQLADLKSPVRALRKLDPVHVREIVASIDALGFCAPILISKDGLIIDGLARAEAARLAGLSSVPCIAITHLSDQEQRVLRLALNRLAEKGDWDLDELKIEFEELRLLDAPIELSGFALDEIDQIVICGEGDEIEASPLEPKADTVAIARIGDAFQLGPHRLICGDATDRSVLQRLMGEENESRTIARIVLTDEPYNVNISGNVTRGDHREFAMASGEMTDKEFRAFNLRWMEAALPHLCEGGVFGTFIDWRGQPVVHEAATALRLTPLNLIVWTKTNAGLGSLYRSQFELLPLFKKGAAPHINNIELGRRGRWRSNVWTYAGASSLGSDARRGLKDHPTVKPVVMLKDALIDLTHRGDIVLDPFLGSGSTLIAAERTGRICRGIELDPLYVDLIVQRYEAETANAVRLVDTGETYADLAIKRSMVASAHSHRTQGDAHEGSRIQNAAAV